MNTSDIEIFLAAAETLSFSQAAQRSYLSRQAVSRKIQALESELRTTLFLRAPLAQHMELTDDGRQYYAFFLSCRRQWDALQETLKTKRGQSIQVAFLEGLDFPPDFQRILFDVCKRYGMSVEFNIFDMHNIAGILQGEKYDMVLCYEGPRLNLFHEYQRIPVAEIPMVLAAKSDLFLQAERASDFQSFPVATWIRKDQTEDEAVEKCTRHCMDFGFTCSDVRVFPNRDTARAAIESGECVGICTQLDRLAQSRSVSTYPLSGFSVLSCLWAKNAKNQAVLTIVKALEQQSAASP